MPGLKTHSPKRIPKLVLAMSIGRRHANGAFLVKLWKVDRWRVSQGAWPVLKEMSLPKGVEASERREQPGVWNDGCMIGWKQTKVLVLRVSCNGWSYMRGVVKREKLLELGIIGGTQLAMVAGVSGHEAMAVY